MAINNDQATTAKADAVLVKIADYVTDLIDESPAARETARYCLMDSLGCALLSQNYPACTRLLGPTVEGAVMPGGARVPGTSLELDPVQAAFNISMSIRWLDFNDTWLAAEWGHPSDNIGAILAIADYLSRINLAKNQLPLKISDVLTHLIKAYEIQGVIALENSFNRVGLDHVLLVRVACTAVVVAMLGGARETIISALSNAWIDGGTLRVYRHAPNTGSRKSWAAGDACSRGVWLALMAMKGEMGYPSPLTTPQWGYYDVLFSGKPFKIPRNFACYVVENILFKVSFAAEFHAQTAIEAALQLHSHIKNRLNDIEKVMIQTQEAAIRIIDKVGPLHNPADRDHCLQYMVAIALIFGRVTADDYEDRVAADPRIDALREKMQVIENTCFSTDYLDPEKRSIANSVQVCFTDGTQTEQIEIEYPIGHRRRRSEAMPLLRRKFATNLATRLPTQRCERILRLFDEPSSLETTPVNEFMDLFVV